MYKIIQRLYVLSILLILYSLNSLCIAAPVIKLCLQAKCKAPVQIKLSHSAWSSIKDLYSTSLSNDKDEQDNIASSINLIESDVYYTLASGYIKDESQGRDTLIRKKAEDLFDSNSNKNNYRNIKTYMGVLLDNYLVTRHFIRKPMNKNNWASLTESGLMLQSLNDSRIYIIETNNSDLGIPPVITPYQPSNGIFNFTDTPLADEDNDEFE